MRRDPPLPPAVLERLCAVLGDTSVGLTGAEIGQFLARRRLNDPNPSATKRHRLYDALSIAQERCGLGNPVLGFVHAVMAPARYVGQQEVFERRREGVNAALAFYGIRVTEQGTFATVQAARTIPEAAARANRLRAELARRGVHVDVLHFCQVEFLQDNCFHAVFEATKSVADKLRVRTGVDADGTQLVDRTLAGSPPLLAINAFRTETEQGEQRGFANLVRGLFGTFRNVTAHAPKVSWPIEEPDALDLFSLASFIHRRLDTARSGLAR